MAQNMNKHSYNCPQEILYSNCAMGWALCRQHLTAFKNLKAFYSDTYVDAALATLEDTKKLITSRQTIGARKEARIKLANATKLVREDWQLLKVYITKAFAKDIQQTKLEVAGASLYAKASVDNWSAVRDLIDAAKTFITDNMNALTDNQNMPPQFADKFKTDGDDCINLSKTFFDLDLAKVLSVNKKVDANNAIYETMIEMFKDGQQIFKADEAIRKQFTFSYLVAVHKGEGSASLKGYIKSMNGQPVEGVLITSTNERYIATTNKKGYYRINKIAAGDYTFTISKAGYDTVEQLISFKAGTSTKLDVQLPMQFMQKVA